MPSLSSFAEDMNLLCLRTPANLIFHFVFSKTGCLNRSAMSIYLPPNKLNNSAILLLS